jgi:hypothetical protein
MLNTIFLFLLLIIIFGNNPTETRPYEESLAFKLVSAQKELWAASQNSKTSECAYPGDGHLNESSLIVFENTW